MGIGTSLRGFRLFAGAAGLVAVLVPATAAAHAYVMQPPSRDLGIANLDARAHKTGPCGGSPRVGMPTQYEPGATVQVKWQETIGHRGCYQIAFSPANDQNWVTLKQVDDPGNNPDDMIYTDTVTLPAGVTCKDCTLVVRQLMIGVACTPDAAPPAADTYFSCADIRVGDFPDAGPSVPPTPIEDAGGGSTSGGPTTTPTDGGGKTSTPGASPGSRKLSSVDAGDDGCSIGWGATGGFSLVTSSGLALLALARRRRRQTK